MKDDNKKQEIVKKPTGALKNTFIDSLKDLCFN